MTFRTIIVAAALGLPSMGMAQGWELRAGLERVEASACTEGGACFGVACTAAAGWRAGWVAEFAPIGEGAVAEPIVAIRTGEGRYALTSLIADETTNAAARFVGPILSQDEALLDAIQSGESLSADAGREFEPVEFSLRGSRWAIGAALDLCESGGPDIFVPEDDAEG